MNYVFIHQNFPAQYRHVVRHLASERGHHVTFMTQPNDNSMVGVTKVTYPRDERGPINCPCLCRGIRARHPYGRHRCRVLRTLRDEA